MITSALHPLPHPSPQPNNASAYRWNICGGNFVRAIALATLHPTPVPVMITPPALPPHVYHNASRWNLCGESFASAIEPAKGSSRSRTCERRWVSKGF